MHHMYIVAICTGAINVLTNKGMFNRDLNPLYKPMADDATADAIIKLIASDIAVDIAENTAQPKLVYCPRLSVSMKGVGTHTLPVSVKPAGELGELYTKAYGNKQHQYHMDVAEMFSLVVNSGTAQDYNDAATRYRQMFGEDAKSNNAGYFVFHGGFEPRSGWQERYQGPPFNFLNAFDTGTVVQAVKDPWVHDWLIFWLRYSSLASTDSDAAAALQHVYVSHSASLCWSLLLQGRQDTVTPNMVPRALHAEPLSHDTPMVTVWQDLCVFLCSPAVSNDGLCKSDVHCKSVCLADSLCKGYYLKEGCAGEDTCGAIVHADPRDNELANANGQTTYHHFYAKNLYDKSSGIAFHEGGTFPVGKQVVKTLVYKKNACAAGLRTPVAGVHHMELVQCENSGADRCIETTAGKVYAVGFKDTVLDCAYVHDRISRNVPLACRAACLETDTCIAWTWDAGTCTHYTGVGEITTSSVVPDLDMLVKLGMDTARPCGKVDHVFDKCVQKCVHIRNKLHQGWCNHAWVNCKAGKYAEDQTFIPEAQKGQSVCTGGFHPEASDLLSSDIVKYKTSAVTYWPNYDNFLFPKHYGHESNRQPVSIGGRVGAYTASRCGDIGAYIMHIGKDTGNTTFKAWKQFSEGELHTNVEGRMSKLVGDDLMHMHSWPTHTFVSMGQGNANENNGNAYASPLAGTGTEADGMQPITFPKCQISFAALKDGSQGRLYSFTRGNQCVNTLNKNMQAYYIKSMPRPTALDAEAGPAGTPYYGTTIQKEPTKSTVWDDGDVHAQTNGLKTRTAGKNAAKHLLCYRFSPSVIDSAGFNPLTSTPVLIDSHSNNQCRLHDSKNHLVDNVAFERAYGDNEQCHMTMQQMKTYYATDSVTPHGTVLRQFPRNVGCKEPNVKTTLLSGFQPFYSRVLVDRQVTDDAHYYYRRETDMVDGTPESGTPDNQQCKRGTAMRNNAIDFLARACVEGPKTFFSRPENRGQGVAFNKDKYPLCCKLFQIDNNCNAWFYAVTTHTAGDDGNPVAVGGVDKSGASNAVVDTADPDLSAEGWPFADQLRWTRSYRGFATQDAQNDRCPGMTSPTQHTDAEYAFAAAHPSNQHAHKTGVEEYAGIDVYMVHNPAMQDDTLENDHVFQPRVHGSKAAGGGDYYTNRLGGLPKVLPTGPDDPYATGHGTYSCAGDSGKETCKCQGVVYYGQTKFTLKKSFNVVPENAQLECSLAAFGNDDPELYKSKQCWCHAMPDMYFEGSRAYGVPVKDPNKFQEIAHHQGLADHQYAADHRTYQQQCWKKCKANQGTNAYCVFTGARFYGEVAAMGPPTCYLAATCEKEVTSGATVASFRQTTATSGKMPEESTLDDLVNSYKAMAAESLDNMHPADGYVQNAQRAFADGGTKVQATTYDLPPHAFSTTPRVAIRNANAETDKTHWKMYVATAPNAGKTRYASKYLPTATGQSLRDRNAVNAGIMCPLGVHVGGRPDVPLSTLRGTTDEDNWHPLAQTTLMCPHDKPVRCSKLVIIDVAGGTCEYSSETGKQQFQWSGAPAQPIEAGNENMENWKSKLGQNAPCHRYDFACHSIDDDEETQVCGHTTTEENALGGTKCGSPPDSSESGGFCGISPDTKVLDSDGAAKLCESWPTGARTVCPNGFAYIHNKGDVRAMCVPAQGAHKDLGVLREHLAADLVVDTEPNAGQYYYMSSCDSLEQVATANGMCVQKNCPGRLTKELCEVQDVIYAARSCTWTVDTCTSANISPKMQFDERDFWWPGFVQKKGAFSGIGPGYVKQFPGCEGKQKSCKGFDKCGSMEDFDETNCIGAVLGKCCRRHGVSMGVRKDGKATCEASPSTKCAGGRFMYNTEDSLESSAALDGFESDTSKDGKCPLHHPWVADHAAVVQVTCQKWNNAAWDSCTAGAGTYYKNVNQLAECISTLTSDVSLIIQRADAFALCNPGKVLPVGDFVAMDGVPANAKEKGSVCCRAEPTQVIELAPGSIIPDSRGTGDCAGAGTYQDGKTVAECADICLANAAVCVAFVYWLPGAWATASGLARCFFKSTCGAPDGDARAQVYKFSEGTISHRECIANASTPCVGSRPCKDGFKAELQICSCHEKTCKHNTKTINTTVSLTLETSVHAGYKADLHELFLALVDSSTGAAVPADSCTGPQARLEGAVFPSCACQPLEQTQLATSSGPVYTKPGDVQTCQSDSNCIGTYNTNVMLYTHNGTGRAYNANGHTFYSSYLSRNRPYRCNYYDTCAPEKQFPGEIAFTEYGMRHLPEPLPLCQVFDTVHRAQHWCVGMGDSCAFMTKVSNSSTSDKYCALPALPAGEEGGTYTVYQKHTAHHIYMYRLQNMSTPSFNETVFTMFDANAAAVCSANTQCMAYKVDSGNIHLYTAGGSLQPANVYVKGAYHGEVPNGTCAQFATAEHENACRPRETYFQRTLSGLAQCDQQSRSPQLVATYAELTHACQQFTTNLTVTADTTYDVVVPATIAQCPPLQPCQRGTNVRQGDKCVCLCDDFFAGPLCDRCSSANRDESCRACKVNFMTGQNDVCICQPGFDLKTSCTTCMPGFEGAFCQTSTCAYTLQETVGPLSYTLKNVAIAYDAVGQLYDGVIGAGDGRVPFSMQNTFVKVHGKVWFLYASPTASRVEVIDTVGVAGLPADSVHTISGGEWLYSIPERAGNTTVADIVADRDTWGYVCTLGAGGTLHSSATTESTCAGKCLPATCGSWHLNGLVCEIYTLVSTPQFKASEHNIDTRNCRSGGVRLAGKYRNLPADTALAVPNAARLLTKVPANMRWTVVCAHGIATAKFILSEYRRHPWTGGPCAQRVQLTWLYSLPRGPAMDVTTRHYHGLTRSISSLQDVVAANATACADKCKNADPRCELWIYTAADKCSLGLGEAVLITAVTAYTAWGGALKPTPMVPLVASMSSQYENKVAANCVDGIMDNMCHAADTTAGGEWLQLDLGSSHRIYAVKIWNRVDSFQDRLGLHELQLSAHTYAPGVFVNVPSRTGAQALASCLTWQPGSHLCSKFEAQTFANPHIPGWVTTVAPTAWTYHYTGGTWINYNIPALSSGVGAYCCKAITDWTTCGTYTAPNTAGPFEEPCTGTARHVRIHQLVHPMTLNLAEVQVLRRAYLLPDKSAALPDIATSISAVSNYRECCSTCAGSTSWQMAGARCACYDGGKMNGQVGECYVPTMPATNQTCNVAITMLTKTGYTANRTAGTCFNILAVTNYSNAKDCEALCLDEEECDVAHHTSSALVCTLLQCTRPDLAKSASTAPNTLYIKAGACVQQANGMCHYRPRRAGYASGACSANGATVAYQADMRMYYNDDHEGNSVPVVAGTNCSDKLEPALAAPFGRLLQTADTNLLMNRFEPFVYPSTTGFLDADRPFREPSPTVAQPAVTRDMRLPTLNVAGRRRRVPLNAFGVAPNREKTFQMTQAIAVPMQNEACHEQARLATVMTGLKLSSVEQGRCSGDVATDLKSCMHEKYYTSALETVQAAFEQQLASCHAEAVAMDHTMPIQLMVYIQPREGLTRIQYHGLPTYYVHTNRGDIFENPMQMGDLLVPEISTPIATVFETPSPTPSPHIDNTRSIECTLKEHCCFETKTNSKTSAAWRAEEKVVKIEVGAVHATDIFASEQCMELCARFLLCRVVEWQDYTCHMWSLPIELAHLQHNETYWVQPPDTGCVPSASITETGITGYGSDGTVFIKQDCCLRHLHQ